MQPGDDDRIERKLAAVLAADVAGYSRLMGVDEEGTLTEWKAHRRTIVDPSIKEHHGRIVKSTGDGILVEFASVVDAVRCAVEIQRGMAGRNAEVPPEKRIELRIGVNLGDIIVDAGDIFGDGVNVAARLEGLAEPGGICISRVVRDEVRDKLALGFEDMGEREVKNIARPIRAYRVRTESAPSARAPIGRPGGENGPARPDRRRRLWAATAVVVILVAGIGIWLIPGLYSRPGMTQAAAERASIAVLPFSNLSGDPQQDYFSDGLTEDILISLAHFPQLFVIARNSTFAYKGKSVAVNEVGRALGVRYVLEGSVQKAADRVRITAQLIDAQSGGHLWADRYERPLSDVFAVQDEITERIATTLVSNIERAAIEAARRKAPENLGAYDLYLQGRELRRTSLKPKLLEAEQLFEKAISLDPSFAPSFAELALSQFLAISLQWDPSRKAEFLDKGFSYARRAIALAPSLPLASLVLGDLYLRKPDYEAAVLWGRKAIELNPGDAESYAGFANILTFAGRAAEAIPQIERALRLDPNHPPVYDMFIGRAHVFSSEYEKGIPFLRSCVERAPDFWPCRTHLAAALGQLGRIDEAHQALQAMLRLHPLASVHEYVQQSDFRAGPEYDRVLDGLRKAGLPE